MQLGGTAEASWLLRTLEMKQRLRAEGRYWMLGIWFVVIAFVFVLWSRVTGGLENEGGILFDLVLGFVLLSGRPVAPGLSANAVNGDRAGRTLVILQVTLLTPGQLLAGKWLASWVGSLAFLVLSAPFIFWALFLGGVHTYPELGFDAGAGTLDDGAQMECATQTYTTDLPDTQYITWMLAANPFVVVADAVPYSVPENQPDDGAPTYMGSGYYTPGAMESVSQQLRSAQAGPDLDITCEESSSQQFLLRGVPVRPLGLAVQGALAAGLLLLARRKLTVPAKRLAQGTRIA